MGLEITFWILAVVGVIAALLVVSLRNVFHQALSLILCFLTVAGIFVILSADFLAVIQVLVYVGAISILIILAIMLTREFQHGSPANRFRFPAVIVSGLFLGIAAYAVVNTGWQISGVRPATPTIPVLGARLFAEGGFFLAVEIAPILLLVAILGAIILVREK